MPDQLHGPPTGEIVLGFWALVQTKSKHKVDVAHGILSVLNLMQVWLGKGWGHLKLSECFVIKANCSERDLRCLSYIYDVHVCGDTGGIENVMEYGDITSPPSPTTPPSWWSPPTSVTSSHHHHHHLVVHHHEHIMHITNQDNSHWHHYHHLKP